MTFIRPATPGSPKQLSAAEHNTMAGAVNFVVENSKERSAVIHNKRNNVFYPVYATEFLRAGCLVELDGPIIDINAGTEAVKFPPPTSSYESWMTIGQTRNTVTLASAPATYASACRGDSTNGIWDTGRNVYGVVSDPITKGGVGWVQISGICAVRVIINSLEHNFCWPAPGNQTNGHDGILTSGYGGRPGYQLFGKPRLSDGSPFTWAYILLNLTTSPFATKIIGQVKSNFTPSDTTFLMKNIVPFDGLLPTDWKESDYGGVTIYNTLKMEGVTDFYAHAQYNWFWDRWECTAIECGS